MHNPSHHLPSEPIMSLYDQAFTNNSSLRLPSEPMMSFYDQAFTNNPSLRLPSKPMMSNDQAFLSNPSSSAPPANTNIVFEHSDLSSSMIHHTPSRFSPTRVSWVTPQQISLPKHAIAKSLDNERLRAMAEALPEGTGLDLTEFDWMILAYLPRTDRYKRATSIFTTHGEWRSAYAYMVNKDDEFLARCDMGRENIPRPFISCRDRQQAGTREGTLAAINLDCDDSSEQLNAPIVNMGGSSSSNSALYYSGPDPELYSSHEMVQYGTGSYSVPGFDQTDYQAFELQNDWATPAYQTTARNDGKATGGDQQSALSWGQQGALESLLTGYGKSPSPNISDFGPVTISQGPQLKRRFSQVQPAVLAAPVGLTAGYRRCWVPQEVLDHFKVDFTGEFVVITPEMTYHDLYIELGRRFTTRNLNPDGPVPIYIHGIGIRWSEFTSGETAFCEVRGDNWETDTCQFLSSYPPEELTMGFGLSLDGPPFYH